MKEKKKVMSLSMIFYKLYGPSQKRIKGNKIIMCFLLVII